jgi:hypothetical protein
MASRYKGHKFTFGEKLFGVGIIGQAMTIDGMQKRRYPGERK